MDQKIIFGEKQCFVFKKKKKKHTSSFRKQFVCFLEARKWGWGGYGETG